MDRIRETVDRAVADFDGIREAIGDRGVEVAAGTPTREYGALIRRIPAVRPPVQGMAVTRAVAEIVLDKGETRLLDVRVAPGTADPRAAWSSSDPVVASVDGNGLVTALETGVTEIRAACADGVSARVPVTVRA